MGKNLKGKELGKGLYQRKDGRYEARIFVRGTGKTFSIYGTNLQHLKKERNAYLANVSPGIAGYDPRISVSKWYEKWMLIYVVHSVKATTLSNYVNGFERVREYIGYMRLIEVRPTHILDMIKGLEEEIALAEKENRDPNLMDVHPHIFRHTFVTRCQITTPKKSASNRKVPLTDAVIAAFMSWKEKQDRDKEKLGKNWGKPNILLKKYPGLIFTTSSGRSYLPSSAQTECRRIVGIVNKHEIALAEKENRDPNLMDVHPHIFRHTFVTRCIQSGMDAATVKKIAGHSDEKMTNYYTHIEEEHIDDEYELYIQKYGTET